MVIKDKILYLQLAQTNMQHITCYLQINMEYEILSSKSKLGEGGDFIQNKNCEKKRLGPWTL